MNNKYFSFLEYLNNKGLYYKTNVLEEFLLTMKIDNILLLNGIKGIGKTSLAEEYIKYINLNNKFNQSISSTFTIGKTNTSKGFVVKRINAYKLFPHMKYEDECYCTVEDMKVKGRLNILPRFFFKPQENKEFVEYITEESKKGTKTLNFELLLDEPLINNYIIIDSENFERENENIISFINNCSKESRINHFIIFDNVNENNIKNILFKHEKIPSNLTIIYTGLIENISQHIYDFSIINISSYSPIDYLQNNMDNVNLENVSYLEKYDFQRLDNINDIKKILQNINIAENKSLYNTLLDELNGLYYILNEININITNQIINDILNYIIIGWKYENKPEIFENWKKYYDSQLTSKIIPLVENNPMISDETLNKLINYCNNEYNYYRAYNKLINIKE